MKTQNLVQLALEALDYEDNNIRELRAQKARSRQEATELAKCTDAIARRSQYFSADNTCLHHDIRHCSQCTRYAEGRGHPDEWL